MGGWRGKRISTGNVRSFPKLISKGHKWWTSLEAELVCELDRGKGIYPTEVGFDARVARNKLFTVRWDRSHTELPCGW